MGTAGEPWPVGAQTLPSGVPDDGRGTAEFCVYPAEAQACFRLIFPSYGPIPLFRNWSIYSVPLYIL